MSYDQIITLIGSLGFPIVCCGAMMYVYWKTLSKIEISIETLKEVVRHNNEVVEDLIALLKSFNKGE